MGDVRRRPRDIAGVTPVDDEVEKRAGADRHDGGHVRPPSGSGVSGQTLVNDAQNAGDDAQDEQIVHPGGCVGGSQRPDRAVFPHDGHQGDHPRRSEDQSHQVGDDEAVVVGPRDVTKHQQDVGCQQHAEQQPIDCCITEIDQPRSSLSCQGAVSAPVYDAVS